MRSTTFLTTALQLGTFLTAAEAARGRRRAPQGYGAEADSVQWSAWSASTTFKTVTTPAYQSWASTTTQAYKQPYNEEGDEEWNDWQEDDEDMTTRSPLSMPTQYNPFYSTTTKAYNSWEQAPKAYTSAQQYNSWEGAPQQYTTTSQYNSWEHAAKPSPTTFLYQSWVGTAKRYNGDDEDYQGWESTATQTPEAYQTWTEAYATPTSDAWHTWVSAPTTHVVSYTTKVVTVEEYASWTEAAAQPTNAYSTWESTSAAPYQTWTEATNTYHHAAPTQTPENVQEWAQWQGQVGNGNGNYNGNGNNGYGNGNNGFGNGPVGIPTLSTSFPAIAIPTNAAGLGNGVGGGLGSGLGGGLGGAGGAGAAGGLAGALGGLPIGL